VSSPLRVNDMVIVVNGKSVGGMTTAGVEIELEQAGPDLILIVSRYKFPEIVQKTVAQSEQSYLSAFDSAINNDRELGWTDLGSTAISSNFDGVIGPSLIHTDDDFPKTQTVCLKSSDSVDDSGRSIERGPSDGSTNSNYRKDELRKVETESAEGRRRGFVPIQNVKENVPVESKESNTKQKPRRNDRGAIGSISVDNIPDDISESKDDGTDDGNAWCGCVCGATHKKSQTHKEIFWIQCDACSSWYDCSSDCLGFSESQAKAISSWTCWGCPVPASQCDLSTMEVPESQCDLSNMEVARPGRVSISPVAAETASRNARKELDEPSLSRNETTGIVGETNDTMKIFGTGDLVYVTEHGWAGVNNPEGVAKVLNAYLDKDGDQVYDVKYVVGPKVNGVLPEYLCRHYF
jgi:hypothetical protein